MVYGSEPANNDARYSLLAIRSPAPDYPMRDNHVKNHGAHHET